MRKQRAGITLVALVITIIILLILAGITIGLVFGENGILKRAQEGREEYLAEEQKESNLLSGLIDGKEIDLPKNDSTTKAGTEVKIPSEWYSTSAAYVSTEDGSIVKEMTKVATVTAVATGNGETVPVPLGFYYVGGTINSGVVISDDARDQNKYAGVENVPAGVKYNEDGTVKVYSDEEYKKLSEDEKKAILMGNQFVWIPVSVNEYKKVAWRNGNTNLWNTVYETTTHGTELPQIQKYSGFYIGRYEAGTSNITLSTGIDFASQNTASNWKNDNFSIRDGLNQTATGQITLKAGEIPYYHADYYTALKLSNSMYNTDCVQSVLATGTMWDSMLKFIAGNNDNIVISSDWGNYTNGNVTYTEGQGRYGAVDSGNGTMTAAFTKSDGAYHYGIKTTAISEEAKKKNLYDVAGNLWEWTQEAAALNNTDEAYVHRGGSFAISYSGDPTCYRRANAGSNTDTDRGFRPALCMK